MFPGFNEISALRPHSRFESLGSLRKPAFVIEICRFGGSSLTDRRLFSKLRTGNVRMLVARVCRPRTLLFRLISAALTIHGSTNAHENHGYQDPGG
jgi:hypothetical protein